MTPAKLLSESDVAAVRSACAGIGVHAVAQPMVRLGDGVVVGYEALGRVLDEGGRGPAYWLETAEACGLRVDLELAFLHAAVELGTPPDGVPLFVNVSALTLLDRRFEAIHEALPEHVLEISEHDQVRDYAQVMPRLRAWRAQGVLVAVDDVGSGYANMAHVLQLDPAFVKIDRFIVAGLDHDPRRRALVAALHTLAAASGAVSIAEGVERPEELAVLRELGIDVAQGFLLGRPGPAWPAVTPLGLDRVGTRVDVSAASNAHAVAKRVAAALARDPDFLPSVYLARGGRLRCVARSGQWLVLDGIESGMGLTGTAYARDEEVLVHDVTSDPRYRQAVPGVLSELAIPLHAGGRLVGVLNVDARRRLSHDDVADIRRAAAAVEQRLTVVGIGEHQDSLLQRLGRVAPAIAMAGTLNDLARTTVRAALELGGFDTACLWSTHASACQALQAQGPDASLLKSLDTESVEALRELVRDTDSCYSDGPDLDLAAGPTSTLRDRGIRAVVLVPLRDGRRLTGFLMLTRRSPMSNGLLVELVQAVELLGLQAGSRAAALQRLEDLEIRATRDPLTGVANRSRLDRLLDDPLAGASLAGGWLAAVDLDRFKTVNDRYGHAAGDEVLRAVARTLEGCPGGGLVVRLGGDEFALLLTARDMAAAVAICADVRYRTATVLAQYDADVSIGLAPIPDAAGIRLALLHADEALYQQKGEGGGGVTTWAPEVYDPTAAAEVLVGAEL